jgi:crotonobetainyl-CoA:carnitine CoA-transferase CaiB-like acyl-CoA transferase
MAGALTGLLVLSLEQAVAAPYCSCRLADAGARVIKVERPEGDFAREYDSAVEGMSSYFVWLNRSKESLVADIKGAKDVPLLEAILERADIFIQNLAPGAATRSGMDSEVLRARFPRMITVDISGYGESGAYRDMKAYDLLVQAESGLAMISGHPAGPGRVGVSICDIACGAIAYSAVLQALLERARTGSGKSIKLDLFSCIADWMNVPLMQFEQMGRAPTRTGLSHPTICPYGAFELEDGTLISIAIQNEREWALFCTHFLQEPELCTRRGYETNIVRTANRAMVDMHVARVFSKLGRTQALARLDSAGTAFGFVNDIAALARHPALRRVTVDTPSGPVSMAAPPDAWVGTGRVPALGEHTAAISTEFLSRGRGAVGR